VGWGKGRTKIVAVVTALVIVALVGFVRGSSSGSTHVAAERDRRSPTTVADLPSATTTVTDAAPRPSLSSTTSSTTTARSAPLRSTTTRPEPPPQTQGTTVWTSGKPYGRVYLSYISPSSWHRGDPACNIVRVVLRNDSNTDVNHVDMTFYAYEYDADNHESARFALDPVSGDYAIAAKSDSQRDVRICAPDPNQLGEGHQYVLDRSSADTKWTWVTGDQGRNPSTD
jgi:hypothetical protein